MNMLNLAAAGASLLLCAINLLDIDFLICCRDDNILPVTGLQIRIKSILYVLVLKIVPINSQATLANYFPLLLKRDANHGAEASNSSTQ